MKNEHVSMVTASGKKVFPFALTPDQIDEESIARHLATEARWSGATRHPKYPARIFYSVAEHSLYVAEYVRHVLKRPDLELEALLHDAPEYLVGDQVRPVKYSPAFREPFKALEDSVERVICQKYGLIYPLPPEVKTADDAVCRAEWEQIVPKDPNEVWNTSLALSVPAARIEVQMVSPYTAYLTFVEALDCAIKRRHLYQKAA